MLTELHNGHFSERLFYADSVSAFVGASPNYNGNIAVSRITNADTAFVFTYAYDTQNRLTAASQLTGYGSFFSEQLTYDDAGNILTFKRFNNNRTIDDLSYDYGNEGNRLLSITDNGQGADRYDVIEYHNSDTQADTTFRYDANGNLIYDLDRGISVIKYNILNLPDTIQFSNGNQIVNLYDAAGRKYKTITYFAPETAGTSHYEIEHYTFDTDTVTYAVTEYAGNIMNTTTKDSIELTQKQKIFNTTGYYTDGRYYHYVRNHLGSICLVIESETGSMVQETQYSASGLPLSTALDEQPYLYNGKEFISAHGLNEYDSQARMYYAPIMRTTTMDPLAEKYYYISPYAWCGNNPILNIDKNGQYYYDFWTGAYHSSYGNHDEVDWAIIQANNYVEPAPTKELTPLHAVAEFIAGSAPTERNFTEGDKYTQQFIKDNPRLQTLLDNIAQEIFVSNIKEGEENYDLAEKEDIERFGIQVHDLITAIGTLLGDRIGCSIGNVAASTIGSFDLHWELEQYDNNGDAVVRIKMTNPMSAGSFLKPSMIGYSDFWRNHKISSQISEFFNSNANKSGMLHTVNMTMTWTTTIKNPNR